jgi:hypothetical protein
LNKASKASYTIALFFSVFELLMDFLSRVQDDTSIVSTRVDRSPIRALQLRADVRR